jgi:hypothetical protein
MKSWKLSVRAFACSAVVIFYGSIALPALAQEAGAETSAVQAYVARAWEISSADYRIDRQPDEGNLHVYRVTINPDVVGVAPAERVFDVSVSEEGAKVVGESMVKAVE